MEASRRLDDVLLNAQATLNELDLSPEERIEKLKQTLSAFVSVNSFLVTYQRMNSTLYRKLNRHLHQMKNRPNLNHLILFQRDLTCAKMVATRIGDHFIPTRVLVSAMSVEQESKGGVLFAKEESLVQTLLFTNIQCITLCVLLLLLALQYLQHLHPPLHLHNYLPNLSTM
jgi:hypothetical protein